MSRTVSDGARAGATSTSFTVAQPIPILPWRGSPVRKPIVAARSAAGNDCSRVAIVAIFERRDRVSVTARLASTTAANSADGAALDSTGHIMPARAGSAIALQSRAMILQGKTVVVSGVGPGLGREVVSISLRDGANVVMAARGADRLASLARELDPSGEHTAAIATDITDADQCAALMSGAVDRFGAVHGLVQVAALDALFGGVTNTPDEDWMASFNV